MAYLLNVAYLALVAALSPWLLWTTVRRGKYREGYAEKLLGLVPHRDGAAPCVWLHAVSVGEVNLLGVLVRELRSRRPDLHVVISSTTRTGLELARKKYADLTTFYCPLDFSWACRTAMRRVRPDLLVLAELELWPNLIRAAKEQGTEVAIINGRLGERSWRGYRRVRFLVRRLLARLSLVAVQNDEYRERFADLGCNSARLVTTGSLKYDGASTDRNNPKTRALAALAGFGPDDVVFLAGSTQEGEEATVLEVFQSLAAEFPHMRLVLVPRHAERFDDVACLLKRSGVPLARRSSLLPPGEGARRADEGGQKLAATLHGPITRHPSPLPKGEETRILLVDAIGELGAWWGTADIAFVGGSFGDRGGQNMIEPAAYGAAVSFGPNTWNFRDIVAALLSAEAAVVVRDGTELQAFVRRCLTDRRFVGELGARAQALVQANLGATARTVDALLPLLPKGAVEPARRVA
jgi:3-deoxy-D-manno-octulosonic-acid transferase